METGLFPMVKDEELQTYWGHMAQYVPWAKEHVDRRGAKYHPLILWGDDARFNERGEKLVCIAMSHVLDDSTSSLLKTWPLFVYKHDTWLEVWLMYHRIRVLQQYTSPHLPINVPAIEEEAVGFDTLQAFLKVVPWLQLPNPQTCIKSLWLP